MTIGETIPMKKIDLIISAPHFYTMTGDGLGYRKDSAMAVDRGRILAIAPAKDILNTYTPEQLINARDQVVLPGFIDGHMHMSDGLLRGLAQDTSNWMMHGIGPFQPGIDNQGALWGTQLAVAEALAAGTTCFGEFSSMNQDVARFMDKAGVRCQMTVKIREAEERIYGPGELYAFDPNMGSHSLDQCLEAFGQWNGQADGRITILFGPQGPDFVSKSLLKEIRKSAMERQCRIHMHVQQGDRETEQIIKRYDRRPISFLDENLIAVHLTDAKEEEAALVAQRGASMILCSGSIGIIDGIVPPAKAFQDAGGCVALGSDQAPGNNCHNMFNEMKLTALFNKIRFQDPEVMPAWKVLRMATIEGARALGLHKKIGSLEPGKQADFITVNLKTPSMAPVYTQPMRNIVPNLVYSARGNEVDTVVVNGVILYEKGRYLTLDLNIILEKADQYAKTLGPKGADDFWKINGANAGLMHTNRL